MAVALTTVQQSTKNALEDAITTLAAVCDGASSNDQAGYNKYDRDNGHRWAERINANLELWPWVYAKARKLLTKYERTQLQPRGIRLPSVEAVEDLVAALNAYAPDLEAVTVNHALVADGTILRSGSNVVVKFARYDAEWVARIKAIPTRYRKYDGGAKTWTLGDDAFDALVVAFPSFRVETVVGYTLSYEQVIAAAEMQAADVVDF